MANKPIAYTVWSKFGLWTYATADGEYVEDGEMKDLPIDIEWVDVLAAIEAEGWCGTYCDVEPIVIVPFDDDPTTELPEAANSYLEQGE